ncbi:MAG: MBL fold metallo-hydrolase [Thalassobius sp.]|nr:MBL fold metallo-hydrolase [Thalassovita sp.]
MHKILLLLSLFIPALLQAQTQEIETNDGTLTIEPILHASMVMDWDGLTIYVDPYGGGAKYEGMEDPDLVIITDIHGDHLNKETLNELNTTSAKIIAPKAVTDQLTDKFESEMIHSMANGDKTTWEGIGIEAIPMYNLPETEDSRHPKGRGNGYVLTIGGKRIYISGDTEDIPEMRKLKNIDVAFVCMNLPYTMDVNQAADAVLAFKPKVVYPFHYRGGEGKFSDVKEFKDLVNSKNKKIEVRLLEWYPQ